MMIHKILCFYVTREEKSSCHVYTLAGVDLTIVVHKEVTLGQLQWANKHLCQVVTCANFLKVPRQLLPHAQPQIHRIVSNEQKKREKENYY
jgi:hypothetical protein